MKEIRNKILELKKQRSAVILAHNYQLPEVQDIADYIGDSLELSIKAMNIDAKYIVFAGVDFMAEQAAILARDKIVLHPEPDSQCPMAKMITVEDVRKARRKYPDAPVVIYVNSPAVVKAEADYVVTSSSAVKLVSQLDSKRIIFGPDRNLAEYVAEVTGKEVIPVPENGYCPVHVLIKPEHILELKKKYPEARVTVHPECIREVRKLADHIGSTSQMVKYVLNSSDRVFIIGTEIGLIHRIKKENPDKELIPAYREAICTNMKKITLDKIYRSLRDLVYPVRVPDNIASKVLSVLERSYEILGVEIPWKRK
ncbi:MAG: quinolinate synthase NadA [Thermoprotei archaeon]